jgi:hypothetical protein
LAFWGAFNFFKYTQWQCICVKFWQQHCNSLKCWENWNWKFWKIVLARNSVEDSAEFDFLRKTILGKICPRQRANVEKWALRCNFEFQISECQIFDRHFTEF